MHLGMENIGNFQKPFFLYVLQRVFLEAISDVTVVLGMRQV